MTIMKRNLDAIVVTIVLAAIAIPLLFQEVWAFLTH
jgi:hypothetical protein